MKLVGAIEGDYKYVHIERETLVSVKMTMRMTISRRMRSRRLFYIYIVESPIGTAAAAAQFVLKLWQQRARRAHARIC